MGTTSPIETYVSILLLYSADLRSCS